MNGRNGAWRHDRGGPLTDAVSINGQTHAYLLRPTPVPEAGSYAHGHRPWPAPSDNWLWLLQQPLVHHFQASLFVAFFRRLTAD